MKKQIFNIRIIYFLKFFADALFSGYLSMYFLTFFDKYSFEYGLLLGIIPFCALIGNFIWGLFSKSIQRNLFLVRLICALETLSIFCFIGFGTNFTTLLIFTILFGLFNSPYFTIQDGLGSSYSKKEDVNYGSLRIFGSCGYLGALTIGALLIYLLNKNYRVIFAIACCLYVICLFLWFFVKPFDEVKEEEKTKIKYREVIKNKTFILYFIFYILLIGCNNVADSYLFSRMNEVGLTDSQYSLVFASEVLLEIIVIFLITRFIKEENYPKVLLISSIILFSRTFIFGFDLPLGVLVAFAPLRGFGWGAFLAVHIMIIRKIVSLKLVTKSISLLTISLSLMNGVMTILGTSIASKITFPTFYLILSILQLIGIFLLTRIKFKKLNIEIKDKGEIYEN